MRKTIIRLGFKGLLSMAMAIGLIGCSKDKGSETGKVNPPTEEAVFHILFRASIAGSDSQWSMQHFSEQEVQQGTVTFAGNGRNIEPSRVMPTYATHNGKYLYVYNQGKNLIEKYEALQGGSDQYQKVGTGIDSRNIVGNGMGHWTILDDKTAVVYLSSAKADATTNTIAVTLNIGVIDLDKFEITTKKTIALPAEQPNADLPNIYVSGVARPVVVGNKIYFGVRKNGYDFTKPNERTAQIVREEVFSTTTLVLDYPSLTNLQYITSDIIKGSSVYPNLFYAPAYIKTENNDIYHTTIKHTKICKITGGQYDNTYSIDLGKELGVSETLTVSGMFYAKNNIVYIVYAPETQLLGTIGNAGYAEGKDVWGVARINLATKEIIKMNVPEKLWLIYNQNARMHNGKLYMILCPTTGVGNVYIFDPSKADPNGFTKGATLHSNGGVYMGIF